MTKHTLTAATTSTSDRLLSLDVLRGLTVIGMILVTDPGTYSHVYPQIRHALWSDPTATDLIFPCFLTMVGLSLVFSFSARLRQGVAWREVVSQAGRRSLFLIVSGLIVNGFPYYHLASLRIPGILQRIGICYFLVTLLYLPLAHTIIVRRTRQIVLLCVCAVVLSFYLLLLTFYPTPGFGPGRFDPLGNLASVVDRAVFHQPHMFQWGIKTPGIGITFDPEGILSTLGALGATLFGVLAGEELHNANSRSQQCAVIASAGTMLWLLSLGLRPWVPLNKQIYTPSFALWSSGLSLIVFAGLLWLIDIRRFRRGWTFALTFGTNAILAFFLSQLITSLLSLWRVRSESNQPIYMVLDAHLFATWLPPRPASLAYAISIVILNLCILYPFYRRRIFVRL